MTQAPGARPFDIRSGEGAPVLTTLLLSVVVGIPRVFTFTVANTLFVEALGPGRLPWAYLVSAPVVAGAGLVFVRAERRRGLIGAGIRGAALFALLLGMASFGLTWEAAAAPVAFILVVITEAEFTFTNVTFWGAANRIFSVRQAARLFGLVSAGQALTAIVGGLAIPSLVDKASVAPLLLVSVAGHLLIAVVLGGALRRLPTWKETPPSGAGEGEGLISIGQLLSDPYLRGVALLIGLQVVVFYGVDNAFYFAVEGRLGRGPAVAAFLGRFLIALGVVSAIFQLFISSRWRRWLGLRSALISTPSTLFVLSGLALAAPHFDSHPEAIFVLVVILKLWERVAVDAIHSPSYYSLFLPLSADSRSTAQSTLESVVAQAAAVLGGLGLVSLNEAFGLGVTGLLAAVAMATVAWAGVAAGLSSRYRDVLRSALARRRLEPGALPIADATTLDLLSQEAQSEDPARVLRSVELLEELEASRLSPLAEALLAHPHPRVVEAAARILERRPDPVHAPAIRACLARGGEPRTIARVARALAAAEGPKATMALRPLLESPSPRVRAGAAVALTRYCGADGLGAGRSILEGLATSSDCRHRRLAARALGSARRPEFSPILRDLVDDLHPEVARTALWAAGRSEAPQLLEPVMDALRRPGLVSEAARAAARLASGQVEVIAGALDAAARSDSPGARLGAQRLLRVFALDPSSADVRALLFHHLGPRSTRRVALAALAALAQRPSPSERTRLEAQLSEELATAALLLEAEEAGLGLDPLLRRGLTDEAVELRDRILLLLGLLYDSEALEDARRYRIPGSSEAEALALELIEAALPEEVAAAVLPALEWGPPGPRLKRLGGPQGSVLARLSDSGGVSPALAAQAGELLSEGSPSPSTRFLRALLGVPLLQNASLEHLELVVSRAETRCFVPGDRLLRLDDPEDRIAVFVEGEARWAGADAPSAGRVVPSDLALIRPSPRRRELVASTSGQVILLDAQRFDDLLDDAPNAAWRVLEHLCQRARGSTRAHPEPSEHRFAAAELPYSELLRLMRELEALPALARVPSTTLAAVARSARESERQPGEVLIEEGAADATLYILISGRVRVEREGVPVAELVAPAVVGELAAILPAPRSASIVAISPCRALALPREALYALMQQDRKVLGFILELVVSRLPDSQGSRISRLRIPIEDTTV